MFRVEFVSVFSAVVWPNESVASNLPFGAFTNRDEAVDAAIKVMLRDDPSGHKVAVIARVVETTAEGERVVQTFAMDPEIFRGRTGWDHFKAPDGAIIV